MNLGYEIGDIVSWTPNNGHRITGPITSIENGILVVTSIGYPGGEGWRVDPTVFKVANKSNE